MNKKFINYIIFIIIINIVFINFWYSANSEECNYTCKIDICLKANKPWASSWPLSIKDFLCIQSNDKEKITYQIILDDKFKKVDKKIENYLSKLEKEKWRYFWSQKVESPLIWINDIYKKLSSPLWEYWKEYYDLCDAWNSGSISTESIDFLWWSANIKAAKWFFANSTCMNLAVSKLWVYRQVASDILKSNKHEARKDDRKKHTQAQKTKYDQIKDLFMINLWYLERIWSKVVEKTRNVYHG